ncbi:hypothetical protein KKA14_06235 [bacterium]|nr:hypothetical protein [bacterium]
MKNKIIKAFSFLFTLSLIGCSHSEVIFNYSKFNMYSASSAGNLKYKEISPISEEANGFVWDSPEKVVLTVASNLFSKAKSSGGNGLMNVEWFYEDEMPYTNMPTCRTAWGWFALGGVGGLVPWLRYSRAKGVIINISEADLKDTGWLQRNNILPLKDRESFLKMISTYAYKN